MSRRVIHEPSPMEALLGPHLLKNPKDPPVSTAKLFQEKEVVALYFSASWCPPCQSFSPKLIQLYNDAGKTNKLEIVYISSDKTLPEFEAYYAKMPWLAIPSDKASAEIKTKLAQRLQITGIPALIVLDVATGNFITANGRQQVEAAGNSVVKKQQVIWDWKVSPKVPIEEGIQTAGAAFQNWSLTGMLMALLKNPMYIFGMLYMVKWAYRKFMEEDDETE